MLSALLGGRNAQKRVIWRFCGGSFSGAPLLKIQQTGRASSSSTGKKRRKYFPPANGSNVSFIVAKMTECFVDNNFLKVLEQYDRLLKLSESKNITNNENLTKDIVSMGILAAHGVENSSKVLSIGTHAAFYKIPPSLAAGEIYLRNCYESMALISSTGLSTYDPLYDSGMASIVDVSELHPIWMQCIDMFKLMNDEYALSSDCYKHAIRCSTVSSRARTAMDLFWQMRNDLNVSQLDVIVRKNDTLSLREEVLSAAIISGMRKVSNLNLLLHEPANVAEAASSVFRLYDDLKATSVPSLDVATMIMPVRTPLPKNMYISMLLLGSKGRIPLSQFEAVWDDMLARGFAPTDALFAAKIELLSVDMPLDVLESNVVMAETASSSALTAAGSNAPPLLTLSSLLRYYYLLGSKDKIDSHLLLMRSMGVEQLCGRYFSQIIPQLVDQSEGYDTVVSYISTVGLLHDSTKLHTADDDCVVVCESFSDPSLAAAASVGADVDVTQKLKRFISHHLATRVASTSTNPAQIMAVDMPEACWNYLFRSMLHAQQWNEAEDLWILKGNRDQSTTNANPDDASSLTDFWIPQLLHSIGNVVPFVDSDASSDSSLDAAQLLFGFSNRHPEPMHSPVNQCALLRALCLSQHYDEALNYHLHWCLQLNANTGAGTFNPQITSSYLMDLAHNNQWEHLLELAQQLSAHLPLIQQYYYLHDQQQKRDNTSDSKLHLDANGVDDEDDLALLQTSLYLACLFEKAIKHSLYSYKGNGQALVLINFLMENLGVIPTWPCVRYAIKSLEMECDWANIVNVFSIRHHCEDYVPGDYAAYRVVLAACKAMLQEAETAAPTVHRDRISTTAVDVLSELCEEISKPVPEIFESVIQILASEKQLIMILDVFRLMQSRSVVPTAKTFRTCLSIKLPMPVPMSCSNSSEASSSTVGNAAVSALDTGSGDVHNANRLPQNFIDGILRYAIRCKIPLDSIVTTGHKHPMQPKEDVNMQHQSGTAELRTMVTTTGDDVNASDVQTVHTQKSLFEPWTDSSGDTSQSQQQESPKDLRRRRMKRYRKYAHINRAAASKRTVATSSNAMSKQ